MRNKIEITKMNIQDFEEIKESLIQDFDEFWTPNILKGEIENDSSEYIVAKRNDEILGFAGIWVSPVDVQIMNIVVKKSERKKGIGNLLLDTLIDMAKKTGKDNITLEVNENNIAVVKMYENRGFEMLGIRKKYYNGKDNGLIMTKKLK